jgi:hypothetical protein
MGGALIPSIVTSTVVYRQGGVWYNIHSAGMDTPVVANVDIEPRTGLRLFFSKPMIVPEELFAGLSALQPADPSWTPGILTLL